MAFLKAHNPDVSSNFDGLATEYMRHGEELGIRWDYAFFQMILETGYLKYKGDVKADQNNFAGLGATGRGARGEKFADVTTGARAHIEHLLMYTGEPIENPVAERTKNIQEWNVLTSWRKSIKGPMTFAHLAKKWAPSSRRYGRDIGVIADRFFDGACNDPDPAPELVAEARKGRTSTQTAGVSEPAKTPDADTSVGDTLARKANDKAKEEGTPRAGLGGVSLVAADAAKTVPPAVAETGSLKILNAGSEKKVETKADAKAEAKVAGKVPAADADKKDKTQTPAAKRDSKTEVAALATTAKPQDNTAKAEAPAKAGSCRVWTASYGGTKAVIIKAKAKELTNFTVLDVNDGREEKEAAAYIMAYAKGGKKIAEFKSSNEALNKAFELCPEG